MVDDELGVCYPQIIFTAMCIMELELGGKGREFCAELVQSGRKNGTAHLDFACDLFRHLPENKKHVAKIERYALGREEESGPVREFISRVPGEVWAMGARISLVM